MQCGRDPGGRGLRAACSGTSALVSLKRGSEQEGKITQVCFNFIIKENCFNLDSQCVFLMLDFLSTSLNLVPCRLFPLKTVKNKSHSFI